MRHWRMTLRRRINSGSNVFALHGLPPKKVRRKRPRRPALFGTAHRRGHESLQLLKLSVGGPPWRAFPQNTAAAMSPGRSVELRNMPRRCSTDCWAPKMAASAGCALRSLWKTHGRYDTLDYSIGQYPATIGPGAHHRTGGEFGKSVGGDALDDGELCIPPEFSLRLPRAV